MQINKIVFWLCCTLILAMSARINLGVIKLLLDSGADIDKQNNDGYTALIFLAVMYINLFKLLNFNKCDYLYRSLKIMMVILL